MALGVAVVHALEGEVDEEQVGEGVDDLGRVGGGIVILVVREGRSALEPHEHQNGHDHLFTPVQGGGDGRPIPILASGRVGDSILLVHVRGLASELIPHSLIGPEPCVAGAAACDAASGTSGGLRCIDRLRAQHRFHQTRSPHLRIPSRVVSSVTRTEVISPFSIICPGPVPVMAIPNEKLQQLLQEISQKASFAEQQLGLVKAQMAQKARESRMLQLSSGELDTLPQGTPVYDGVGKMFMLTTTEQIQTRQAKEAKDVKAELANLEKKRDYLDTTLKNSRQHMEQILTRGG
nr:putative prefoldin subunit 1 [Quercus suber]